MMKKGNPAGLDIDILTVISIAIVAFIIQNVLHEFVGHGGATVMVGGKILSLSTAYLEHDLSTAGEQGHRIVAAAGTIVNILAGLLFWIMLRGLKSKISGLSYFMWLSMTVNLLTGTGYFLFSGAAGIGDWNEVIKGLQGYWLWRIVLIISGIILYLLTIWLSLRELIHFLGDDTPNDLKRAFRLSFVPYLAGSISSTIGAFLNPVSMVFVITSAASTFGGTSALAWMTQLYSTKLFSERKSQPIKIKRNLVWISLAAILLLLHVFWVGPGIKF